MENEALLKEIEDFAARNGIAPATVTSRAVGNSRLYQRMKCGGSCTLTIKERLYAFMQRKSASPPAPQPGVAAE